MTVPMSASAAALAPSTAARSTAAPSTAARSTVATALAIAVATTAVAVPPPVLAQDVSTTASVASGALSALPLVTVMAASALSLQAGASVAAASAQLLAVAADWVLVSVQVSANGMVWILERAADGARIVARVTTSSLEEQRRLGRIASGQRLSVVPVIPGWLIGNGAEAIAFVPRSASTRHFHHERLD